MAIKKSDFIHPSGNHATNCAAAWMAAPLVLNDEAVRLAVIDKLGWIKR